MDDGWVDIQIFFLNEQIHKVMNSAPDNHYKLLPS